MPDTAYFKLSISLVGTGSVFAVGAIAISAPRELLGGRAIALIPMVVECYDDSTVLFPSLSHPWVADVRSINTLNFYPVSSPWDR